MSDISDEFHTNLVTNFVKAVKGYHYLHNDPIKESIWEDINADILTHSGYVVISQSNGSHKPGSDLSCSLGNFSNKSTKYEADTTSLNISSYRLTSVCSNKTPGKIEDIKSEINKRKNFTHYSIIAREERGDEIIYEWYLIPSDHPVFNPDSYTWSHKLGKQSKNDGIVTGWETDTLNGSKMSITFSMSSQLWIHVSITEDMKQFMLGSCRVKICRKYSYIQLYDKENSSLINYSDVKDHLIPIRSKEELLEFAACLPVGDE